MGIGLLLAACPPPPPIAAPDSGHAIHVCTLNDTTTESPAALTRIGCPDDFAALSAEPLDTSLPGARTVKYVIDRASLSSPGNTSCIPECATPKVCAGGAEGASCQRHQIYFQNTAQRALHYYFARDFLSGSCRCRPECVESCDCDEDQECGANCTCDPDCPCPCATLPRRCTLPPVGDLSAFNAIEYIMPSRRFLLGSITLFEATGIHALNLAPADTATAEMIEQMYRLVAAGSYFGDRLHWLPASDAQERLIAEMPDDIKVVTAAEIYAGITYQPLNLGQAVGQVRVLRARDLDETYVSPREIVVLDAVPNDITPVAGLITQAFQTPLSHVNVLSQNRGTPNMALRDATHNPAIRALDGRWVRLTVAANDWEIVEVGVEEAEAWWQEHRPPPLEVPTINREQRTILNIENVDLEQMGLIGAKAANYGALHKVPYRTSRHNFEQTADRGRLPALWQALGGNWSVVASELAVSGGHVLEQSDPEGGHKLAAAELDHRNFDCRIAVVRSSGPDAGLGFLIDGREDIYTAFVDPYRGLSLGRASQGKSRVLASQPWSRDDDLPVRLAVRVHDLRVDVFGLGVDGEVQAQLQHSIPTQPPGLSCGSWTGPGITAAFDDLVVTPLYTPRAFAVPFAHYFDFLAANGFDRRLDELLADESFRADGQLRRMALSDLREAMIAAPAPPALEEELLAKLRAEYPGRRMRFRSSTNAEDLGSYSGAGLYSSLSGDPDDPERPVMRAVQTVWASLFNARAFEERELLSIPHLDVGMAVLVHRSFPDELANGVAITSNIFDATEPAFYINVQAGEESVTNPAPGLLPDQFLYYWAGLNPVAVYLSYSTINGGEPVMSRQEVHELASALLNIHRHFQPAYGDRPFYAMDVEFKLDSPDRSLIIKQARPAPGRGEVAE